MDVIGIGQPVMDFLVNTDRLPQTDQPGRLREYGWQGGGKVATAILCLGRLGGEAGIIGNVGDDEFGRYCVADFQMHNVDTSRLRIEEGKTTEFCVCISESQTQGRCLIGRPGTVEPIKAADFDESYFEKASYIHIPHVDEVMRAAARTARRLGVKVSIDLDNMPPGEEDYRLMDVVVASELYYKAMFGEDADYQKNCRQLLDWGAQVVVFTLGAKGCAGMSRSETYFELPAFQVDVRDTTGAGDVFHGAFLFGLVRGMALRDCARFASAVAAIKCTRVGGRAGIPDYPNVMRFLETGDCDFSGIDKRVEYYRAGLTKARSAQATTDQ